MKTFTIARMWYNVVQRDAMFSIARDETRWRLAFVPVQDTAKISVVGFLSGETVVNTLHVKKAGTLLTTDLQAITTIVAGWLGAVYRNRISQSMVWTRINVLDLSSSTAPSLDTPISPTISGANTSGSQPNNVALVISLRSLARGRSSRGRWFVAGIPRDQSASSVAVQLAYASQMGADFSTLMNNLRVSDYTPVVVSTFSEGVQRSEGVTFPITGVIVDTAMDSQRRRLALRGV